MSKSRPDKLVDPLDMIEIYGTDALRFYLITAGSSGGDIKVDVKAEDGKKRVERIEGARNFANKLWNAVRFVLGRIESYEPVAGGAKEQRSLSDTWIRARGDQVVSEARRLMDDYQYGEAGRVIYDFAWGDFCDWYIELSKLQSTPQTMETLIHCTDQVLRLLHPFMPYVTEELWQHLKQSVAVGTGLSGIMLPDFNWPALMLAPYPTVAGNLDPTESAAALRDVPVVQDVIRAIRNARAEYKVPPERRVPALISAGRLLPTLSALRKAVISLARVDDELLRIEGALAVPDAKCVTLVLGEVTAYLPLSGLVDLRQERQRLQVEYDELSKVIARSEELLNGDFARRAPPALVEKERAKLADANGKRDQIRGRLAQL